MSYSAPANLGGTPSGLTIPLTWDPSYMTGSEPLLLLHFDGTNGSTTFTDSSPNNVTMTPFAATIETSTVQFGTGAGNFVGGSFRQVNSPTLAAAPILNIDTGDFTYEFWANPISNTSSGVAGVGTLGVNVGIAINFDGGGNVIFTNFNGTTINGGAISTGVWTHIAFVRQGSQFTGYVNGIGTAGTPWAGSLGLAGSTSTATVALGYSPNTGGSSFSGFLDEFRLSNYAVYTANFTPPVAPFNPTGVEAPGYDVYRGGISIGTFTGPSTDGWIDTVPSSGVYTYNVAGWQSGIGDLSALSAPYVVAIGTASGFEAKFVPAVDFKAIMVANPGDINPRIWPPQVDTTIRVSPGTIL